MAELLYFGRLLQNNLKNINATHCVVFDFKINKLFTKFEHGLREIQYLHCTVLYSITTLKSTI